MSDAHVRVPVGRLDAAVACEAVRRWACVEHGVTDLSFADEAD